MDQNHLHNLLSAALVAALACYLGAGFLFAIAFAAAGVQRIDARSARAGWGFRLLIMPGAALLWPLLLRRWARRTPPPVEKNAHR